MFRLRSSYFPLDFPAFDFDFVSVLICRSSRLDSSGERVRRRFRPDESDMLVN
jgi:hypothetical protein